MTKLIRLCFVFPISLYFLINHSYAQLDSIAVEIQQININHIYSGTPSAMAVNPDNPKHIIIAAEVGTIFESVVENFETAIWQADNGFRQSSTTDVLVQSKGRAASDIDNNLWVTTFNTYDNDFKIQIWQRDASRNWQRARFDRDYSLTKEETMAWNLTEDKLTGDLYCVGNFGIARKLKTSDTWQIVKPSMRFVSIDATTNGTVVAASIDNGIHYSTDHGDTWSRAIGFDNSLSYQYKFALRAVPNSNALYLTFKSPRADVSLIQLYCSRDNGATWSIAENVSEAPASGGGYPTVFADYFNSKFTLYVSNGFHIQYLQSNCKSVDVCLENISESATLTWTTSHPAHPDFREIQFISISGRRIALVIGDAGLYYANVESSNPSSYTWTCINSNTGLNMLEVMNVTGNGENDLYFGTWHNNFISTSNNFINTRSIPSEGSFVSKLSTYNQRDENTFIGYTPIDRQPRGLRNMDGSPYNQFTDCSGRLVNTQQWNYPCSAYSGTPIFLTRNTYIQECGNIVGGTQAWFKTSNTGCAWLPFPNTIYPRVGRVSQNIGNLSNPTFTFVGITKPDNIPALAWIDHTSASPTWNYPALGGMPNGIAQNPHSDWSPIYSVDPSNANTILAVNALDGKLMKSIDRGNYFEPVENFNNLYKESDKYTLRSMAGSGNAAIFILAHSPYDSRCVILATVQRGVFISWDGGNNWHRPMYDGIEQGLISPNPTSIHWVNSSRAILSTFGMGLYNIDLSFIYKAKTFFCTDLSEGSYFWSILPTCRHWENLFFNPLLPWKFKISETQEFVTSPSSNIAYAIQTKDKKYLLVLNNKKEVAISVTKNSTIGYIDIKEVENYKNYKIIKTTSKVEGLVSNSKKQVAFIGRKIKQK